MIAERLGALAANSMACMLSTTIKPGLVDRRGNGIYKDMDFFTVLSGIRALYPWYVEIAEKSIISSNLSPMDLFARLRKLGMRAENEMLTATSGISTHKGAFFLISLCVAAAGRIISGKMYPDSNTVCVVAAEMSQGICNRELDTLDVKLKLIGNDSLTNGEKMFLKHGISGIRGEAESGFITIKKHALPLLRALCTEKTVNKNDMYLQTFMSLMANTIDTGILAKENMLAVEEMMDRAKGILERGGALTPLGREKIEKLDIHMKARNIAPCGSASLLAAAIFLHSLDQDPRLKLH